MAMMKGEPWYLMVYCPPKEDRDFCQKIFARTRGEGQPPTWVRVEVRRRNQKISGPVGPWERHPHADWFPSEEAALIALGEDRHDYHTSLCDRGLILFDPGDPEASAMGEGRLLRVCHTARASQLPAFCAYIVERFGGQVLLIDPATGKEKSSS